MFLSHPLIPHLYDISLQIKCDKYWPDTTQNYGDISVTLVREEHNVNDTTRTFTLKRVSFPLLLLLLLLLTCCIFQLCSVPVFVSHVLVARAFFAQQIIALNYKTFS